jgi:hypothetical protein
MRTLSLLSTLALALPLLACAHGAAYDLEAVGQTRTTSGDVAVARLDDGQIAEILRAAFAAAVDETSVSAALAPDARVADYASAVHRQYRAALDEERQLIEESHVVPQPTEASRRITFESAAAEPGILGRSGDEFERAFLGRQVDFQRTLLAVIDGDLLPSVHGVEQRREILEVRPLVARMLGEASQLETSTVRRGRSL